MVEADVQGALGAPSSSVTDKRQIEFYIGNDVSCVAAARRVLVYDRWFREDVSVALDDRSTVVCVRTMMVLTH
jgi:hypothetical protein